MRPKRFVCEFGRTRYPAPCPVPVESVTSRFGENSVKGVDVAVRWSAAMANTPVTSPHFMSSAPRPYSRPSLTTPPKGGDPVVPKGPKPKPSAATEFE